jgi:hypothetical protein
MAPTTTHEPSDAEIAVLVALADGSLPTRRRPVAETMTADSPELSGLLAAQRGAVVRVRALDVRAPARLRARIEAERDRARRRARRRARLAAGILAGLAVAALIAERAF